MSYFEQESERLTFRKLTKADIETWIEFFNNNHSLKYFGFDEAKTHEELSRDWILKQINRYSENGFGQLAVIEKSTNKLIGLGGIIHRKNIGGRDYYEISYSLKPTAWAKGFGTEIAKQIKSYGIASQLTEKFISIIHINNKASMHVAKKNGMTALFKTNYQEMPVVVFGDK